MFVTKFLTYLAGTFCKVQPSNEIWQRGLPLKFQTYMTLTDLFSTFSSFAIINCKILDLIEQFRARLYIEKTEN